MTFVGATELRAAGRAAIRQAALAHGLPPELTILSERWNTVARLGDSGVVAKAASIGHLVRHDSIRWYQQEIDVCRVLAAKRAPVQMPYTDSAIVDEASGIPVSLWHVVPGKTGEASEQHLVDSLAEIHRLGAGVPLDQPWFATLTCHFTEVLDAFHERELVDAPTIRKMKQQYQRIIDSLGGLNLQQGFIHGDAQRKNAISQGTEVIWIDLEECSIGPLAWDLACLAKRDEFDTDRILDRYAEVSGSNRIPGKAIEVLQQLRDLEALTWMIAIQEAREPEFQMATAEWLERWRVNAG